MRAGAAYHVGGHAIANEENDVLGLALLGNVADNPLGVGLGAVVVVEGDGVLAGLVEGDAAVGLGGDVDDGGGFGVLGVQVLEPLELPLLNLGLVELEGLGKVLGLAALLGDGDLELLVGLAAVSGLGAVDGGVDLDTEIKELTGEEVALVGGQNAAEIRAATKTLVSLRRDLGESSSRDEGGGRVELGNHNVNRETKLSMNNAEDGFPRFQDGQR